MTFIKITTAFYCLGLLLTQGHSSPQVSRSPQSVLETYGSFTLASGTQGCPQKVEILRDVCKGYVMKSKDPTLHIYFCDIDQPVKTKRIKTIFGSETRKLQVTREDNLFRRREETVLKEKNESVSIVNEDIIILDETGKLLWERQYHNEGFSCLFAQE